MSRRATVRAGAFSLLGLVVTAAVGFLLSLIVARGLGAAGAGAFYQAVALGTLLLYLTVFGADTGLLRGVAARLATSRTAQVAGQLRVGLLPPTAAATLAGAVLFAAAGPVAERLFDGVDDRASTGPALVRLVAVSLPFFVLGFTVLHGAVRGFGSLAPLVWTWQVGMALARLAVVAVAALGFGSLTWAVLGWAAPAVPVALVALVALGRRLRAAERSAGVGRADRVAEPVAAREFWSFAAPRGAASLFEIGITWTDVLLLGLLRPSADVGVYAVLSRFVTTGTLAVQAGRTAISARLADAFARGDRSAVAELYGTAGTLVTMLSWPIYLSLAVFARPLLEIFGPGFGRGASALSIISVAALYLTAFGNVSAVLLMGGRSRWTAVNTATALVVNVGLNLVLIPTHGIVGAAVAWAAAMAVDTTMGWVQVRFLLGLRVARGPFLAVAGLALLVFGAGGLLVRHLVTGSPAELGTLVLLGGFYLAALWPLRERLGLDEETAGSTRGHPPSGRAT
ncbi:oligosaccharide flippase family protein [Spongisporangium articulatum]|uniref:Oligosaccharide flippase family protein n=1 Tax=Spongisporangium articulatum TaxID=3362603 RepID=A0ABW8ARS2_9ACTN